MRDGSREGDRPRTANPPPGWMLFEADFLKRTVYFGSLSTGEPPAHGHAGQPGGYGLCIVALLARAQKGGKSLRGVRSTAPARVFAYRPAGRQPVYLIAVQDAHDPTGLAALSAGAYTAGVMPFLLPYPRSSVAEPV